MSTPRISPLFEGKKGPLPPASVLCWTPAVRKQYPLPAPTNSFLKMFFFPSSPFSPSCYNVFSIFNPQPSKLPSSLQILSEEWSFKNQNLNAWLLQFACLSSFIPHQLLKLGQKLCIYFFPTNLNVRSFPFIRCFLWVDVKLFVHGNPWAQCYVNKKKRPIV